MSTPRGGHLPAGQHDAPSPPLQAQADRVPGGHQGHGAGHGIMMLACCVPMLVIVYALVAGGAAGAGALIFALLCTAMMAAMMLAMPAHKH